MDAKPSPSTKPALSTSNPTGGSGETPPGPPLPCLAPERLALREM